MNTCIILFKMNGCSHVYILADSNMRCFLAVCGRGKDEEITGRVCVLFILRRQHDIVFTNLKHPSTLYVDSFSSEMIVKEQITSIYSLLLMIMIIFSDIYSQHCYLSFPEHHRCTPENRKLNALLKGSVLGKLLRGVAGFLIIADLLYNFIIQTFTLS